MIPIYDDEEILGAYVMTASQAHDLVTELLVAADAARAQEDAAQGRVPDPGHDTATTRKRQQWRAAQTRRRAKMATTTKENTS
jgi:hypothetical protein